MGSGLTNPIMSALYLEFLDNLSGTGRRRVSMARCLARPPHPSLTWFSCLGNEGEGGVGFDLPWRNIPSPGVRSQLVMVSSLEEHIQELYTCAAVSGLPFPSSPAWSVGVEL